MKKVTYQIGLETDSKEVEKMFTESMKEYVKTAKQIIKENKFKAKLTYNKAKHIKTLD